MSLATQDFILDLMPGKHPPHIKATQYDAGADGWKFAAHLRYNDEDFAVPSGYTATVEGSLESQGLAFRVNATIDGSVVSFYLDTGDLSHGGRWWAKILLKKGDSVFQPSGFVIDADPAGTQVGTVTGGKGFEQQLKDGVYDWMNENSMGLKYWLIHQSFDSTNPASPSDMPINSYFYSAGSRLGSGWFGELNSSKNYFVYCYANDWNKAIRHYQAYEKDSGNIYEGYTTNSGATVTWARVGEGEDKKGLEYWMIHESHDSSNPAAPSDMPVNSYFYSGGSRLGDGWFDELDSAKFYFVYCYANGYNPAVRHYQAFESRSGKVYEGFTTNSGSEVTWSNVSGGGGSSGSGKTLKVLSIGSSFGQDCTVYTPWLVEEMDSSVSVISGIVYMSGGSIDQFNAWLDNDTALNYYKREEGADAWASGVQKTLKQVLDDEEWDIILVNQSAANGGDWTTFSNLETYLEKMVSYIGHPVKLGYLMPQKALGKDYTYADLTECAQAAYDGSIVSFVIPAGTAIENARNTSLNSIGDRPGGLSADELGHLQEGLPVLIANYVTAAKLLELTQSGIDKIMGCALLPTAEWVVAHNIPGRNGTSTGVTAANILLGQRCAVQAVKKPYEVSV